MTNIYRLALQVQDASNISGVINSLNTQVLPAIRSEAGYSEQGMPYMASHPALILFMDKIVSLMHVGFIHDTNGAISDAYTACHKQAEHMEYVEAEERRVAEQDAAMVEEQLDQKIIERLERAEGYALEDRFGTLERDRILAQRQAEREAGL